MQIDKDVILAFLRERGDTGRAAEADRELPSTVDTDEHQSLLERFGIDPGELVGRLGDLGGGGLGGLGKGLGGLLGG